MSFYGGSDQECAVRDTGHMITPLVLPTITHFDQVLGLCIMHLESNI